MTDREAGAKACREGLPRTNPHDAGNGDHYDWNDGYDAEASTRSAGDEAISVWRFEDAPDQYQALSTNGGDEDWLALVPPRYRNTYLGWMESPAYGCSSIDWHELPYGYAVVIGAHA